MYGRCVNGLASPSCYRVRTRPQDGISRELIRGQVKERVMTIRNRLHCKVQALVTTSLQNWLDQRPEPRGEILSGEAGIRLRGTKDSVASMSQ